MSDLGCPHCDQDEIIHQLQQALRLVRATCMASSKRSCVTDACRLIVLEALGEEDPK